MGATSISFIGHGRQVAYASLRLGKRMGLSTDHLALLTKTALIHDLGVSSTKDFLEIANNIHPRIEEHCIHGHRLLSEVPGFHRLAQVLLEHHTDAGLLSEYNPQHVLANIIRLADDLALGVCGMQFPLHQRAKSVQAIKESGNYFSGVLEAFLELAKEDAFWLDLASKDLFPVLCRLISTEGLRNHPSEEQVGIIDVALLFSKVIDAKSPFTASHSMGVTNVAVGLARDFGFKPAKLRRMAVAGLLHDLGKLSIPDEILDKPGGLVEEEVLVMRQHTYHTMRVLSCLRGFTDISRWAAYHHERLDGRGYPFRLSAENLDLGCRIVAVADIFQALNQDRPYRKALDKDRILSIMESQAKGGALDKRLVGHVLANYDRYQGLALRRTLQDLNGE